ncbi:MAG: endonuclease/exonuclease/phosphatase family protein [Xanthomonadaceae bacterium]|nr:endonuclease/exonuclease/phosphatase family protein [Xanthomonadaceae bacterium]
MSRFPTATIRRLARLALVLSLWVCGAAHAETLRVMSFNVRLPVAADGENRWEARRDLLVETIRRERPDLIGTQELFGSQGDAIVEDLPEYRWFGRGRRGGGSDDEHMGVFYRADAYAVIESGDFWLSDTPDIVGSISWGNLYPRMVTWALFESRRTGARFYLLNTHFPYRDEDTAARTRCARALLARIEALPKNVPVVLTGDFNTDDGSEAYTVLIAAMTDAWRVAPRRRGPEGTFHAFSGTPQRRIDWILTRGFEARTVETVATHRDGRYPSDHFPVMAQLRWPKAARPRRTP